VLFVFQHIFILCTMPIHAVPPELKKSSSSEDSNPEQEVVAHISFWAFVIANFYAVCGGPYGIEGTILPSPFQSLNIH
jgi:hypothetical protein